MKPTDTAIPESVAANNAASLEQPKYSQVKKHWSILALEVHYVRRDHEKGTATAHAQKMNVMVQERERQINARVMEEVRNAAFSRMAEQYQVPTEDIADYIILNISYMGHMSEQEYFTGRKSRSKKA